MLDACNEIAAASTHIFEFGLGLEGEHEAAWLRRNDRFDTELMTGTRESFDYSAVMVVFKFVVKMALSVPDNRDNAFMKPA